jgi:hypothetical protein
MQYSYLLVLLLLSCEVKQKPTQKSATGAGQQAKVMADTIVEDETESGLPEPQFVTDPKEKHIISITDTLYFGDTLKIRFRTPHPRDLAIYDPDENFFFLVYSQLSEGLPPLVDYAAFAHYDSLEIVAGVAKANPWTAGVTEHKLVFTKAGVYRIHLSENLETDDGTPVEIEQVYYTATPRK